MGYSSDRIADLCERHKKLNDDRQTWVEHWDSLHRVFRPTRNFYSQSPGERRHDTLYDGTPAYLRRNLTATLGGLLKPKEAMWFHIVTDDPELNDLEPVRWWLATVEDRLFKAIYSREARFLPESGATDDDLVVFGTGIMWMGTNRQGNRLNYRSMFLRDTCIAVNGDNQVDTVFAEICLTARQAVQRWPDGDFPKAVQESLDGFSGKSADDKYHFLWITGPREDLESGRRDYRGMPYASLIVEKSERHLVQERGYWTFPFVVPRWDITSGEIYGRSPAMIALPDANSLQAMGKTILKSGQRAVDPPHWAVRDGLFGAPRLYPGGVTYVDSGFVQASGGHPPVGTLLNHANLPWGYEQQDRVRDQVSRALLHDILRLPKDKDRMTATEVLEYKREFLEVIGPVFGQLEADYIGPIPERAFDIMYRAGAFPPLPRELYDRNVQFVYESPIAQARKQATAANAARFMELMTPWVTMRPDLVDNFDVDEMSRDIGEGLLFKESWLKARETRDQERQQRAEQAQQREQMAMAAEAAKAGADGGKLIESVSRASGGGQERRR